MGPLIWVNLSPFSTGSLSGDREYHTFNPGQPVEQDTGERDFNMGQPVHLQYRVPSRRSGIYNTFTTGQPVEQGPFPVIGNITRLFNRGPLTRVPLKILLIRVNL